MHGDKNVQNFMLLDYSLICFKVSQESATNKSPHSKKMNVAMLSHSYGTMTLKLNCLGCDKTTIKGKRIH